jgi:hypothetical protein
MPYLTGTATANQAVIVSRALRLHAHDQTRCRELFDAAVADLNGDSPRGYWSDLARQMEAETDEKFDTVTKWIRVWRDVAAKARQEQCMPERKR